MDNINKTYKFIISGGGTGGHIFPAIAIADALKAINTNNEILFVGANGKMEMEKVPAAGYNIKGLDVAGLQRSLSPKNLLLPFKVLKSLFQAYKIIKNYKPNACIGVGGYASAPTLFVAALMGIKTFIQEQNSYPGITNKILSKFANTIFVSYEHMNQFFPNDKIVLAGNPIRKDIVQTNIDKNNAYSHFNLNNTKKTILIIGGSLGARTINQSVQKFYQDWINNDYQILWQTGKFYYDNIVKEIPNAPNDLKIMQFIKEMDLAYTVADVIISRAGALSISELCVIGKPCILIPSPNVSEDHQTKNAMALVNKNAAVLVKDNEATQVLGTTLLQLMNNEQQLQSLSNNIKSLAKNNAANTIAQTIIQKINA
ncbi:MAG: undecaprenyldiphospho-muramoylpentapeptide beta-N-acetylglucosaminyltransferase [Chitinophagales bacterium]|nr:undecaprenyldiphospho-muramoylpentapeptide beta-N-acetylglucosaminyltransferase [Chitinophagales bacterium]